MCSDRGIYNMDGHYTVHPSTANTHYLGEAVRVKQSGRLIFFALIFMFMITCTLIHLNSAKLNLTRNEQVSNEMTNINPAAGTFGVEQEILSKPDIRAMVYLDLGSAIAMVFKVIFVAFIIAFVCTLIFFCAKSVVYTPPVKHRNEPFYFEEREPETACCSKLLNYVFTSMLLLMVLTYFWFAISGLVNDGVEKVKSRALKRNLQLRHELQPSDSTEYEEYNDDTIESKIMIFKMLMKVRYPDVSIPVKRDIYVDVIRMLKEELKFSMPNRYAESDVAKFIRNVLRASDEDHVGMAVAGYYPIESDYDLAISDLQLDALMRLASGERRVSDYEFKPVLIFSCSFETIETFLRAALKIFLDFLDDDHVESTEIVCVDWYALVKRVRRRLLARNHVY